jgi:hypothetical protein
MTMMIDESERDRPPTDAGGAQASLMRVGAAILPGRPALAWHAAGCDRPNSGKIPLSAK